MKENNFVETSK